MQSTDLSSETQSALLYQTLVAVHRIGHSYNLCDLSPYDPAPLQDKAEKQKNLEKPYGMYLPVWTATYNNETYKINLAVEKAKKILGYAYEFPYPPETLGTEELAKHPAPEKRETTDFVYPMDGQLYEMEKSLKEEICLSSGIFPHSGEHAEAEDIEIATVKKAIKDHLIAEETKYLIQCAADNAGELCRLGMKANWSFKRLGLAIF